MPGDLDRKKGEALPVDAFRLDGKLAVVTGAAQGIGAATAMTFAAYGAEVAICDRLAEGLDDTASSITAAGGTVTSSRVLDVRDLDDVRAWVATLPRVDTLVNNAGGTFHGSFLEISANAQRSLIDENFTSVTNFVRECVPKMAPGSTIINVTSVEAFRGAPGFAVYAAMKAAVEHLSRSLSLELSTQRHPGQHDRPRRDQDRRRRRPHGRVARLRVDPRHRLGLPGGLRRRGGLPRLQRVEPDHRHDDPRRRRLRRRPRLAQDRRGLDPLTQASGHLPTLTAVPAPPPEPARRAAVTLIAATAVLLLALTVRQGWRGALVLDASFPLVAAWWVVGLAAFGTFGLALTDRILYGRRLSLIWLVAVLAAMLTIVAATTNVPFALARAPLRCRPANRR